MATDEQGAVDPWTPADWPVAVATLPARAVARRLAWRGFDRRTAGRLVARVHGLSGDFTPEETARLLFLDWLSHHGEWPDGG